MKLLYNKWKSCQTTPELGWHKNIKPNIEFVCILSDHAQVCTCVPKEYRIFSQAKPHIYISPSRLGSSITSYESCVPIQFNWIKESQLTKYIADSFVTILAFLCIANNLGGCHWVLCLYKMGYGFTDTALEASKWLRRQVPTRYSGSSSGVLACVVQGKYRLRPNAI